MDFNYFTNSSVSKIFILAVLITPVFVQAQAFEFDLIQGKDNIEKFEIISYKNDKSEIIKSKAGKITIDKSLVFQADSIFISHSFYKNILDLNRVKENTYYIEEAMELESIVLKSPETFIIEAKGRKRPVRWVGRLSISFPTENLKNKYIKGIELYFPKGQYYSSVDGKRIVSKGKEIDFFFSFTNQKDTIYPLQSAKSLNETLQVKKNGWNYYDLRKYNLNVGESERIFISVQPLDDMVLGRRRIHRNDREKVIIYLERNRKNWESTYFIDSRLFAPDLDRISLAYKIHYYDD